MDNIIAERINLFIEIVYPEISKKKLAEHIGIDYYSFIRYTKGQSLPSLDNISLFCKLGVSVNWLLLGEGSVFSHDRYGEVAKDTFLLHINALQDADLSRNLSHIDIVKGVFDRYGSVSGFFRYLDNNNIEYDKSKFNEFFSGSDSIDFHVEEVLFQINFYFFLYNKDNPNLDKLEYFMENIEQSDSNNLKNSRPVNRVLTQIKELLDDYFLPQNINLKSIIVFILMFASLSISFAQISYPPFSTKTNIDSIYNKVRYSTKLSPDSALKYVNSHIEIIDNREELAWLYEAKGWTYYNQNQYDSSFYYFVQARNIFSDENNMRGMSAINRHFTSFFMKHGYLNKALEYNMLAFEYNKKESNDLTEYVPFYNIMIVVNYKLDNFDKVEEIKNTIDSIYKIIPKDENYVRALIYYSYSCRNREDFEKEALVLSQAYDLVKKIGSSSTIMYSLMYQLAENYYNQGKIAEAIEITRENKKNISDISTKYTYYDRYAKYLIAAAKFDEAINIYHSQGLLTNNPVNLIECKINYAKALSVLDSSEKVRIVYSEILDELKFTDREYALSYINKILYKIKKEKDIEMAYKVIDFLSDELMSQQLKNKDLDPYSDLLMKKVLTIDEEMAHYDRLISIYHVLLIIVGILFVFLIILIIRSVRERIKLYKILYSLKYGYELLTNQVNNELRVLTHKALAFDKEVTFRENAKEYFKEEIIKITRSIKKLVEIMNKQLQDAESIEVEKYFKKNKDNL